MDTNELCGEDFCQKLGFCVAETSLTVEQEEKIKAALNSAYRAGLDAANADQTVPEEPDFDPADWELVLDDDPIPDTLYAYIFAIDDELAQVQEDLDAAFPTYAAAIDDLTTQAQEAFTEVGTLVGDVLATQSLHNDSLSRLAEAVEFVADQVSSVSEKSDADALYVEALEGKIEDLSLRLSNLEHKLSDAEVVYEAEDTGEFISGCAYCR